MPDSVLIPAPLSTTQGWRVTISSASSAADTTGIVGFPGRGRVLVLDRRPGALRGDRRAGDRAPRGLRGLVRGGPRGLAGHVRRRLPGDPRPRDRGADDRGGAA